LLLRKPVAFAQINHPDKIFTRLPFAFLRVAPVWSRWAKPPSESSPPLARQAGKKVIKKGQKWKRNMLKGEGGF